MQTEFKLLFFTSYQTLTEYLENCKNYSLESGITNLLSMLDDMVENNLPWLMLILNAFFGIFPISLVWMFINSRYKPTVEDLVTTDTSLHRVRNCFLLYLIKYSLHKKCQTQVVECIEFTHTCIIHCTTNCFWENF